MLKKYINKNCTKHGRTRFIPDANNSYRCAKCRSESVSRYRKKRKSKLVKMFGGSCVSCGYNKYAGAIHFHHVVPSEKKFGISASGLCRALNNILEELKKCVMICSNCHAEIHAGEIDSQLLNRCISLKDESEK